MRSLTGAVVAVTGASAGIGREAALEFARHGARLAVCARRIDRLEALAEAIVAHRAIPGGAAYAATKAAQVSLTEALRAELRGTGVTACSVHPIGTDTEFAEVASRGSGGKGGGPLGPQQSARDVARAIVRCALRPRPEVYPHAASRLLVWLNALAPGIVDRLAARFARQSGRA